MDRILMGAADKLTLVYEPDLRQRLGLVTGAEATKKEILEHPAAFAGVRFIFATWGMPHFEEAEIKTYLPSLEAVFYAAGSVQSFAREFLDCGVKVFSAWAANAVPVAEYTVAQITLACKGYFAGERLYRATHSKRDAVRFCAAYPGNYRTTVGLLGCGMIGRMVARALVERAYNVLVYDPFLPDERAAELGVQRVETLEELFSRSSVVSNHMANNAATVGMLRGEHFAMMPPHAVFINTGRGAQIVEAELAEVLRVRTDLSAVLDVTYPEPPTDASPFFTLPNVWLTPHIAGSLSGECVRMAEYMCEEYERLMHGEPTRFGVTEKMLETMA